MNAIGAHNWSSADKKVHDGELITPKRRTHNLVKKLMKKMKGDLLFRSSPTLSFELVFKEATS